MKALSGRILIEIIQNKNETESGLTVINTKERPMKAKVLSCGDDIVEGKFTVKKPCQDGDIIYIKERGVQSFSGDEANEASRGGIGFIYFKHVVGIDRENTVGAVFDNVIVDVTYEKKIGSIYIPESSQKTLTDFKCIVVSVGPDVKDDVKIGDEIIIDRGEGFIIKKDNRNLLSISPNRRLAVIS